MVSRDISDREVVKRLFSELSPRYKGCPGGYTRIMKLANRPGDNARVSIIELVEKGAVRGPVTAKEDKDSGKRGKGRRGKPAKRGIRKRLSRKEEGGERNETIGS
jgi:large subunit ribosomal protein L17